MSSNRLKFFILVSLLVHLLLAWIFFLGYLKFLVQPPAAAPQELKTLKLVKIAPPPPTQPQMQYIPTIPAQQAPQADPLAILESERNTVKKSHEQGDKENDLPQLTGDPLPALNYVSSPASPERKSQEAEPAPPEQQKKPSKPTPPTPAKPNTPSTQVAQNTQKSTQSPPHPQTSQAAASSPSKDQAPPVEHPPDLTNYSPDALPVLPPQVKAPSGEGQETTANPSTSPATTAATQNPPPPPPPPPSIASAVIDQSKIDGSRSLEEGAPSPNARETEIGAYKAQLYRAIGSAWYISVDRNLSLLAVGEVKIRFFVRANGVIDNIQVTDRSGTTTVLEGISLKAIDKIQPFNVFSSSMKQQVGDGYWDEISFSIY